jgi:hypothetical protein
MKSYAFEDLNADVISSSVASGYPNLMFCLIDVLKSTGSYPTYPTYLL